MNIPSPFSGTSPASDTESLALRTMGGNDLSEPGAGRPTPSQLATALEALFSATFPALLFCGPDARCFFNDAFATLHAPMGEALPAPGAPPGELWPELWAATAAQVQAMLAGGPTLLLEDLPVPAGRRGQAPDRYWTITFTRIGGCLLATFQETTHKMHLRQQVEDTSGDLHFALEAGELGTWDLDPATMVFRCNRRTRLLFGLPDDEAVDLAAATSVVLPDDRPRVEAAITAALAGANGGNYDIQYTVAHPGKRQLLLRARGRAYFDADGKPWRFSGILQDISTEAAARKRMEKLQQIIEQSRDFAGMATLEGQMVYVNPAGRRLIGIAPDAPVTELHIQDFYPPSEFERVREVIVPALFEQGHWSGTVTLRHFATGELIPFHGDYLLVRDAETGQVLSRAVTLRDLRPELAARRELLDSEQRFTNLVQQAPVATSIYTGPEMTIQWANDAMIRLWGKDPSVIGNTVREALPELEGQPFHELLARVYRTGEMYQAYEDRADLVVDGKLQTFYFNFSYKPLRDAAGNVYGILNMAVDVTETVRIKQRAEASESNFRNLIMKAPIGICVLGGPEYSVDIVNDQYLRLVGRERSVFEGHSLWDVLPEARTQGFEELLDGVRQSGRPYFGAEQPVDLLHNGQTERYHVNFVYEPLKDADGQVHSILVIVIDITQHIEARRKIQEAEKRAQIAVSSADLGPYEIDLVTGTVIPSARFLELSDVDPGAGHSDYIARVHPDDLEARKQAHERMMATGRLDYECRVCRRDGSIRWVQIVGQLIRNEREQPSRIIGIMRDINAHKQMEQELERRVRERTEQLERLNEELQQFTYVSSHDLKEPLRKIHLFAHKAFEETAGLPDVRRSLDKVMGAATRMTHLLNDLLRYSMLSDPDQHWETIDLNDVLHRITDDTELLIKEKGARVLHGELPPIEGISFQVTQLFFNLVANALKFTRPGVIPEISITATLLDPVEKRLYYPLLPDLTYYKIEVRDNGIGFDPVQSERIFGAFQRLHDRSVFSGNGIGLALCKKIAEIHQGSISAEGRPGEGATFTVLLPARQQVLAATR
ncbi:PAS domain S-box protein [Flaviaesturariibacter amylovorans]|uniref:histidine kinase n=1 Tax=Flaviaesturariibacter amylovorans TaxID=1084520 RepID=A0ABP8HN45_9BACT